MGAIFGQTLYGLVIFALLLEPLSGLKLTPLSTLIGNGDQVNQRAYQVSSAGIDAVNGVYHCQLFEPNIHISEICINVHKETDFYLSRKHIVGKSGPRQVWTLSSSKNGTLYFSIPPTRQEAGLPHTATAWRLAAGTEYLNANKSTPKVSLFDLHAVMDNHESSMLSVLTLGRVFTCGGVWQKSINIYQMESMPSNEIIVEHALTLVRYEADFLKAIALMNNVRGTPFISSMQALLQSVNGNIKIARDSLIKYFYLDIDMSKAHVLNDNLVKAYESLTTCGCSHQVESEDNQNHHHCIASSLKPLFEATKRLLISSILESINSDNHLIFQSNPAKTIIGVPQLDVTSLEEALTVLLTTPCEAPHLSEAHLLIASALLSIGDGCMAANHFISIVRQCSVSKMASTRSEFEVRLLRDILHSLVPSILSNEAQGREVHSMLVAALNLIIEPSNGWGGCIVDSSSPYGVLGVRWQFLLAYLGSSTEIESSSPDLNGTDHLSRLVVRALKHMAPHLDNAFFPPHNNHDLATNKKKIGFISSFWRHHSVGRLLAPLILHLASNNLFEVVLIHASAMPVENEEDSIQSALFSPKGEKNLKHVMLNVSSFQTVQLQLTNLGCDVLIWGDMGMEPLTSSLALGRYAPTQVLFWGHPVTAGSSTMDYFISSPLFELARTTGSPLSKRAYHSEQVVLLRGINTMFEKPSIEIDLIVAMRKQLIAEAQVFETDQKNEEEEGEHSEIGTIYMCAQTPSKLHPSFDVVIRDILLQDKSSLVVLSRNQYQAHASWTLQRRLGDAIGDAELFKRVVFVDQTSNPSHFLALQCAADVVLDPYPFGGGVTILEALGCAVPVITAPLLQTVPNLAAGMIHFASSSSDETDFREDSMMPLLLAHGSVVKDSQQYVSEAIRLAHLKREEEIAEVLFWDSEAVGQEWIEFITRL